MSVELTEVQHGNVLEIQVTGKLDKDLPEELRTPATHTIATPLSSVGSLIALEHQHIGEVLQRENGNKSAAAKPLGIERRKLYRMMEKHGIES